MWQVGASSLGPAQTGAIGSHCAGITTLNAINTNTVGAGDYLEIVSLQPSIGTTGTIGPTSRVCGALFNAAASPQTTHATACSWAVPFKVRCISIAIKQKYFPLGRSSL